VRLRHALSLPSTLPLSASSWLGSWLWSSRRAGSCPAPSRGVLCPHDGCRVIDSDEFWMNFVPFRALFLANFVEFYKSEVQLRRIPIPRTLVHREREDVVELLEVQRLEATSARQRAYEDLDILRSETPWEPRRGQPPTRGSLLLLPPGGAQQLARGLRRHRRR
jgi:hypothetical protein